jgi:hypothetical protein
VPLDGSSPAAATAGSTAAGSATDQGSASGAASVVPFTSTPTAGSHKLTVDPNLTVLEDDVAGKTQVYMEFEGHPSYVAASATGARRRRVLM